MTLGIIKAEPKAGEEIGDGKQPNILGSNEKVTGVDCEMDRPVPGPTDTYTWVEFHTDRPSRVPPVTVQGAPGPRVPKNAEFHRFESPFWMKTVKFAVLDKSKDVRGPGFDVNGRTTRIGSAQGAGVMDAEELVLAVGELVVLLVTGTSVEGAKVPVEFGGSPVEI